MKAAKVFANSCGIFPSFIIIFAFFSGGSRNLLPWKEYNFCCVLCTDINGAPLVGI